MLVAKKRPEEFHFYDWQRRQKHNTVYREHHLRAAAEKLKMFGAVILCAFMAIAVIAHYTYVIDVTHQIDSGMRELQALQDQGKHLQLEIASLRTPERLEKMALEIGMQYPHRNQMIILTAGVSR